MSRKTGPCRVLLAFGLRGTAIVLATDNADLAEEISNIPSDRAEDLGVEADGNEPPGVYLFEGEGVWCTYRDFEGCSDAQLEFSGTTRPVSPSELEKLLVIRPPEGAEEDQSP